MGMDRGRSWERRMLRLLDVFFFFYKSFVLFICCIRYIDGIDITTADLA